MKFKKLFDRKKRNRREPRTNSFVLESLEPRLLLSATPMTAAVVTTDHLDYAPGETAVITTSNQPGDGLQFAAGELIRFQVTRTDGMADAAGSTADAGPTGNAPWYVTDGVGGFTVHQEFDANGAAVDRDANGVADWIAPDNDLTVNSNISTTWYVEEQYRNSSLLVTAAGQESGAIATTAFTDSGINTSTIVSSGLDPSTYGDVVEFTAKVTSEIGGIRPTGSVEFFDGETSLGIDTTASFSGGHPNESRYSVGVFNLTAGTHLIHAVFTGTAGSFNDSTSGDITPTTAPPQRPSRI
jgi:Bacterial Ig-like domain (group 3)